MDNLYDAGNIEWTHHVEQALRAHVLFQRDVDYVVKDGEVIIVDEFTGRLMPGRRWCDGLHQAIEAKEGVKIERENQTLATITFQNYFRMYKKLAGMTGTADTEAAEFQQDLQAGRGGHPHQPAADPHREPGRRLPHRGGEVPQRRQGDQGAATSKGQPVLVGTISVEKSERLSGMLKRDGRPARGAERQVPRARGRHRRAGRPQGRRHHRHQHGRPRHRHPAGRQPRVHDQGRLPQDRWPSARRDEVSSRQQFYYF